jgi:hypothetical protein
VNKSLPLFLDGSGRVWWVLDGYGWFQLVLAGSVLDVAGFCWVLLGSGVFQWVLLGYGGSWYVLICSGWFWCVLVEFWWWVLVVSGGFQWVLHVTGAEKMTTVNRVPKTVHRGKFSTHLQRAVKSKHGWYFPTGFQDTPDIAESTSTLAVTSWRLE